EPIAVQNELADISELATYNAHEDADVKLIYRESDGSEKVVATTQTNENGEFTLSVAPSELAGLMQTNESSEGGSLQALDNFNNFNDATNIQQQRERFENLDIALTNLYVVVEDPYFAYNSETSVTVSTSSAKNYNVGTIRGTTLTYRFSPEVTDAENGRELSNAQVEVFRMSNRYDLDPVLKREGFPLAEEERGSEQIINNLTLTKVAEGRAGSQITRLFPRKKGATDVYHVKISAEGYNPYFTAFAASPQLAEGDVAIVNRGYELQKAPPIVEGRVVRRDTQSPMANVPVVLSPPGGDESGTYVTTTDDDGRFTISGIAPNESEYTLIVDGPKVATYEQGVLLNENGIVRTIDPLLVDPTLVTVAGRILNDKDTAVSNATIRWAAGGDPVQSDRQGRFVLANTIGTHTLQISKIGHRDREVTVTIEDPDAIDYSSIIDEATGNWRDNSPKSIGQGTGKWASNLNNIESFQIGETEKNDAEGSGFDAGSIGYTGNLNQSFDFSDSEIQDIVNENNLNMSTGEFSNLTSYFVDLIGEDGTPSEEVMDLGTIVINRSVGKLRLTVTEANTSNAVENAEVIVGNDETTGSTDSSGEVYFDEAPGGNVPVRITGPATGNYVPFNTEISISDNGEVTEASVQLETGARATGIVTAAGSSVEGATVRLEGREDISVKTADDGSYTLAGIPVGEWTLKVSASGYVGDSETATFGEDENKTIDFNLQDSGFDIATLLGFDIEVDELSVDSDTTISGAFVSISSNDLITVDEDLRLPFSNINVYEDNGELKPVGGEVQTDASSLSARLFDFLHVNVNSSSGLIVRQRTIPSSSGFVAGKVEVDYESTFTSATGWTWP
ncbi:MAG TPA: carboxypeptidase-like regulatory domain-containing protein, partial [Halalkalibaculum sp.]|nr:carboxypeptidase-like regulatory domain-containing protein [Halalkalibaculum sp.]